MVSSFDIVMNIDVPYEPAIIYRDMKIILRLYPISNTE